MPHHLHEHVQDSIHPPDVGLPQHPRCLRVDVLVRVPHGRYHVLDVFVDRLIRYRHASARAERSGGGEHRLVLGRERTDLGRRRAAAILVHERHYALVEIPEFVR